jgi:hypothetical protein
MNTEDNFPLAQMPPREEENTYTGLFDDLSSFRQLTPVEASRCCSCGPGKKMFGPSTELFSKSGALGRAIFSRDRRASVTV